MLLLVKKNIEFCRNLFRKLKNSQDKADEFIILDFFSLKTIQLLEDYDVNIAFHYIDLFREFEEECEKNEKLKEYSVFFFSLINILENKEYFFENMDKKELKENAENYFKHLKSIIEV